MAKIILSAPPAILGKANYRKYESWLLENFHLKLCAYCFKYTSQPEIDHYEPKKMSPLKYHGDPSNLLISCGFCNGKGCKSDYHPLHPTRVKYIDNSGHRIHNLREENLADIFQITSDGSLEYRTAAVKARALWLTALFDLNSDDNKKHRRRLIEFITTASSALQKIADGLNVGGGTLLDIQTLIEIIRDHEIFYLAFDINISPLLQAELIKKTRTVAKV